ncbi:MAG: type II toxin-antitoxin system PemK/MazF family toxin [Nitrospirae bacterium]|nr:type II toxin-antitoxin system PemK/MazF family toxin [Nitrospirota bacterium]
MNFSKGEAVLLPIPFSNLESKKVRPAIVVGQFRSTGDLIVVPITSRLENSEFTLKDWRFAGLNVASGIKGHIATIESRLVRKRIGALSTGDLLELDKNLRVWLQLENARR